MKPFKLEYLHLDDIDISISNVRKSKLKEGIDELAKSIDEIGVQQPVVVFEKKDTSGRRFELIIGQRRYLACEKLGLDKIPAIITTVKSETDAIIKSFSENIHRRDLEYRDKMQVATKLREELGSINEVARHLGVSSQTVRNWLGYSGVHEEIKKKVDEGKLSPTTALLIARNIEDEKQAIEIARNIEDIPRSEDKKKIIDVAKENPKKSFKEIKEIISKQKFRKITIDLTQRLSKALEDACHEYRKGADDISSDELARDITIEGLEEWLKKRGFLE